MSRNVYMAFLGTSDYKTCNYLHQDKVVATSVRFVQEATIEFICRKWGNNDRIFIFATQDAKTKNWSDDGHIDRTTNAPLERKGLESCLQDMTLAAPYELIDIPEGHSEKEIWKIFEIIINNLDENDTVYFDITHAFRSIPMLAIVALNYGKILKRVSLGGIFYGAFEVLGPIADIDQIPEEKRNAPVLDLTAFDRMMDWVSAVDRFVESGNANLLSRLGKEDTKSILAATKGQDSSQQNIRKLSENIQSFTDTLNSCRGKEISNTIEKLKTNIQDCEKTAFSPPFRSVFQKLESELNRFSNDEIQNGIQAARWCLDHNLIQQAYTILLEFLISFFVGQTSNDLHGNQNLRDIISQALAIYTGNKPYAQWKEPAKSNKDTVKEIFNICDKNKEIVKTFRSLNDQRNDMHHAGIRDNPARPDTLKKQFEKCLKTTEESIKFS